MNREPTYEAARTVAPTIAAHFARHLAAARERGEEELAPEPDAQTIAAIIDATFWASLQREEGKSPQISMAFMPPEQTGHPLLFERPLPLSPAVLAKLAPAVERPGIHLGVWYAGEQPGTTIGGNGALQVWGATSVIPSFCFVLEDVEPGLLVVKHRRSDAFGKFANVAVLKGEQVKVIDETGTSLPDCPALLSQLLSFTSPSSWNDSVNVLVQLAASMRAHRHGGSLLIVPAGSEEWRQSIVHPILYSVTPPFSELADLVRQDLDEMNEHVWEEALSPAVDTIAGLTAVDGATIINTQYELLAFGVKIRRAPGNPPVEQMVATEPIVGDRAVVVHPAQEGGTRHLSAAQFVYDQRDALAMVASQDGRFTIFAWSPCEEMVHSHRVDSLLM